jgi:hypothetical protein
MTDDVIVYEGRRYPRREFVNWAMASYDGPIPEPLPELDDDTRAAQKAAQDKADAPHRARMARNARN